MSYCKQCYATFERPKGTTTRYCSDSCRVAAKKKQDTNETRLCVGCHQPYTAHRSDQRYCSPCAATRASQSQALKRQPLTPEAQQQVEALTHQKRHLVEQVKRIDQALAELGAFTRQRRRERVK